MNKVNIYYYKKNGVTFILGSYAGKLCLVDPLKRKNRVIIDNRLQQNLKVKYVEQDDAILKQTRKQLDEYFDGTREKFNIPLLMVGTDFQKKVWNSLLTIPYGQTSTYKNQAKAIGEEKAIRAVANANGANALSIVIPCHRIIGTNGKLTGYAGGLVLKQTLLTLEKQSSS